MSDDKEYIAARLLGSLLDFTQTFYKERTQRAFNISKPISREPHEIIIAKELTKVARLETQYLIINIPPGHGKSEMCIHFIAWCMARYPDSQFLYISYSWEIASKHTYAIKELMSLPLYRELFGITIKSDSSAKDNFKTTQGGSVKAFGSSGAITGQDAGLPLLDRFSGCCIIDDAHKPDEAHSDVVRQSVIDNYNRTIKYRKRSDITPFIFIGQCLHEDDLAAYLKGGKDGHEWKRVVLPACDVAGNMLDETRLSKANFDIEMRVNHYPASAQLQQEPQPASGGIFKKDDFLYLDDEPDILKTFITCDTAETDKSWNDATVFSFWGIYQVVEKGIVIPDLYALHWLDCWELRCEPKDLESNFDSFYLHCMQHPVKPLDVAIEKKSTGTTLCSLIKGRRGIRLLEIDRNITSGNKNSRFLSIQRYISAKLVTFPWKAKHGELCIEHMSKITPNGAQKFDDIGDTCFDAVKLALIDKTLLIDVLSKTPKVVQNNLIEQQKRMIALRNKAYYG